MSLIKANIYRVNYSYIDETGATKHSQRNIITLNIGEVYAILKEEYKHLNEIYAIKRRDVCYVAKQVLGGHK